MTKREELLQVIKGMSDEAMVRVIAFARDEAGNDALASDTKAWLDASAADMLSALDELEAGIPQAEKDAWHVAMWDSATPVRYDEESGELVEVEG